MHRRRELRPAHRNGRYWAYLKTGLVVVSNDPFFACEARGVLIPLDDDWAIRVATARRVRALTCGRNPSAWFTEQRRQRIARALRTGDALRAGAHLRDIAISYFSADRVASEPWKTSALKAQIARLARYGRMLVGDGYRQLLRGKAASHSSD
ncbi:DUF2285 domain-containing protein [Rhodophyticola sp. CCM32]|uniref:DUF2285 domain-containing protein n=1 Tax=Rhodophyticola sp. CCM32 TaxID=2916397 RepID=UPI00107FAA90|nr:DUF2285 domain-containing protein [Rhodophyticola sp. CCM32]